MANIDSLDIQITANCNKAVTSLQRLSQSLQGISTSLAGINSNGFTNLSMGIDSLTRSMQSYLNSGVKTADFTRLASQVGRLADVNVAGLKSLAVAIRVVGVAVNGLNINTSAKENIRDLALAVGKLGGVNVAKAVKIMPEFAKEMSNLLKTLSSAPKVSKNITKLTQALAEFSANLGKVNTASKKSSSGLLTFSNTATRTAKASHGLASAIGKVYSKYWLLFRAFSVFRKAIDYASSLTEVQNVVEKTFGGMTERVNEFALESKDMLGMSELTAKKISSRYQAMGGAMGISANQVSKVNKVIDKTTKGYQEAGNSAGAMSLTLTKLAGDMASFYDEDQLDVAKDLEAVYTGMTRPLRKYGIDLSQATLQEYANAQGIETKVSKMSQAEKTMLRYQMVLEKTTAAQRDFVNTADTWANQVKIMKQNFITLGTTIGNVFINAFKPFIKRLNEILVAVNSFVVKVANALGNIFGWIYEGNDVGLLQDTDEDAEALADDLSDANKEAKKLKNTIMGYDELNVMQDPKDKNSGGSGADAGGGGGNGDVDDRKMGHWKKKYESEIDNLFDLGRKIADTLENMMANIDWQSIYQKANNFGKGLAEFLNGLFKPEMFYQVGRTIAGCLNTVINALGGFAFNFDFEQLGLAIAESVNGFFDEFDFVLLADTIDAWVQGIWKTIKTAIENIDWKDVWKGVTDFFSTIDIETLTIVLSAITLKYFGKILSAKVFSSLFFTKIGASSSGKLPLNLGVKITLVSLAVVGGLELGNKIGELLSNQATKSFYQNFKWTGEGGFFDSITDDAKITVDALKEMFSWKNIFSELGEGNFSAIATSIVKGMIFSPVQLVSLFGTAEKDLGSAIKTVFKNYDFKTDTFDNSKALEELENEKNIYVSLAHAVEILTGKRNSNNQSVQTGTVNMQQHNSSMESTVVQMQTLTKGVESNQSKFQEWWNSVSQHFNKDKWMNLWNNIKSAFTTKWQEISTWWKSTAIVSWFNNDVKPWFTKEKWISLFNNIKSAITTKWQEITNWWKNTAIVSWFNNDVKPWFSKEKWSFSGIKDGLEQAFNNAVAGIKNIWNGFAGWLNEKLNFSWQGFKLGNNYVAGGSINLGKLPTFATGGFPPEDGLFMMNHNELIGKFSNGRTAVANNEQITEGIRRAVVDGMMQVVMATSDNNRESGDVNLYLDGRVIAQTTYNNLKTMSRQGLIPKFI